MFKSEKSTRGQVILIILLVTVVGLTIGLSLVSRAVSDVKISTQIAESQKAFSAAESGIESALSGAAVGGGGGNVSFSGATANYNVTALGGTSSPYTIPPVAPGNAQTVWLVDHQADGTLYPTPTPIYKSQYIDVCWGPDGGASDANPAALEISLLYYSKADAKYKIGKVAYDPSARNNFTAPLIDSGGVLNYCNSNKKYSAHLDLSTTGNFGSDYNNDTLVLLRLNPIYSTTNLVVLPIGVSLATQGKNISSIGTTVSGVARKLNVLQGYASLPPAFDYTLFTNN